MFELEGIAILASVLLVGAGLGYAIARALTQTRSPVDEERFRELEVQAVVLRPHHHRASRKRCRTNSQGCGVARKDESYRRREELNREMEQARIELREHERRLEKREDAAEQKQLGLTEKRTSARSQSEEDHREKRAIGEAHQGTGGPDRTGDRQAA